MDAQQPLGDIIFNYIDLNVGRVARTLEQYLIVGSRLTLLSKNDIQTDMVSDFDLHAPRTLELLTEGGMPLFDAILYLSLEEDDRPDLHAIGTYPREQVPDKISVARAVFCCYFYLLTQARYPGEGGANAGGHVPRFISGVLGVADTPIQMARKVCSFEIAKFDKTWIKHFDVGGVGQEALSRFGLGVAGYRMISVLKSYTPRENLPEDLQNAMEVMRAVAQAPADWGFHPVTRNPNLIARYGSINDGMKSIIFRAFGDEERARMLANRAIYEAIETEPASTMWKSWGTNDPIVLNDPIFAHADAA